MGAVLPFLRNRQLWEPNWFPQPENWLWQTPAGVWQGFGRTWRENPGLANLLWLVLDMERPPVKFDARGHAAYNLVLLYGGSAGTLSDLVNLAALNDLPMFRTKLAAQPELAQVPRHNLSQLLLALANGRIERAHAR